MNIAVVVPIYKKQKELSDEDKSFIIQIKKIFYRRTIFLVLPKSIEQEWTDDNNFNVIPFEDKFSKTNFHTAIYCAKNYSIIALLTLIIYKWSRQIAGFLMIN